ncbi:MAG: FAD-dependent oxidoreductase [Bacillota bacterium]
MQQTEIAVVGGGPAGLAAALEAVKMGCQVTLIDRHAFLGGQLVKQTHKFFGSSKQYAGIRGIDIAKRLAGDLDSGPGKVSLELNTTVLGYYDDGVLLVEKDERVSPLFPERIIVATGAMEKMLLFRNNDLPGVYGAGAVQTLMNLYGVVPGCRVLMIGAGNIGLIVSYQLLQAGVEVAAIVEGDTRIGGYLVHAAKVQRSGIPIYTSHTILEATGENCVEGAVICQVDEKWQPLAGTEREIAVDVICLAVGLTPLTELLRQAGCEMYYVPELGGYVPLRDENMQTTLPHIFVAGDAAGVEEASIAMVEGKIAGISAAGSLRSCTKIDGLLEACRQELHELRAGDTGDKSRRGLEKLRKTMEKRKYAEKDESTGLLRA